MPTIGPDWTAIVCAELVLLSDLAPKPYDVAELVEISTRLRNGFDSDPSLAGETLSPVYGRLLVREVQPGLFATGFDVEFATDMVLSVAAEPCLMCGVQLHGSSAPTLIEGYGTVQRDSRRTVLVGLGTASHLESRASAGIRYAYMGVSIKSAFFDRPLGTNGDDPLHRLEPLIDHGITVLSYPSSPALAEVAARMLNNPYRDVLGDLYLESCALAQVAEIARLANERAGTRCPPSLTRRQCDRVQRARELLDQRITDPPTMLDLSKQVGINATSLRAEFQQAYGTSVFGYVREQRLQLARALLKSEDLPVSAIGYRVGFGNPGAFATAYRRRFGQSPKQEQTASLSRR